MNAALAARVRQLEAEREHRRAIAGFAARRRADAQARLDALLAEVIAALAAAMSESPGACTRCPACRRALARRVRNCPHCRRNPAALDAMEATA